MAIANRHYISVFATTAAFLSVTFVVSAQIPDPLNPEGYFPLAEGNTWEYRHQIFRPQTIDRPVDESEIRFESYRVVSSDAQDEKTFFTVVYEERSEDNTILSVEIAQVSYDPTSASIIGNDLPGVLSWLRCLDSPFAPTEPIADGCSPFVSQSEILVPHLFGTELKQVKVFESFVSGFSVKHGVGVISGGGGCEPCGPFDDRDDWELMYAQVGTDVYGSPVVGAEPRVIFVDRTATGANIGTSWIDAYTFLQNALQAAQSGDEIWVSAGIYKPDEGTGITLGDREASFEIRSGVSLYGGFSGTESSRDQRDWYTNETVLSGDLLGNDSENVSIDEPTRADNSLHVVRIVENTQSVLLDGFVVESGQANESEGYQNRGAGFFVRGSAILRDLIIKNNAADMGGGVLVPFPVSEFVLEDALIENNVADRRGGGVRLRTPSTDLRRLTFKNNSASLGGGLYIVEDAGVTDASFIGNFAHEGGGVYVAEENSITLINSIFASNEAHHGGAVYFQDASAAHSTIINSVFTLNRAIGGPTYGYGGAIFSPGVAFDLINSTIVGNIARTSGGGISFERHRSSEVTVRNSILWSNSSGDEHKQFFSRAGNSPEIFPVFTSSLIEGGLPDGTIGDGQTIDADPLFVDVFGDDNKFGTLDDDYRLKPGSPAIDAGSNTALPTDASDLNQNGNISELLPGDFDLNQRIFDGGSGTATVDIGAFEYGAPPIVLANDPAVDVLPETAMLLGNYPNPFNPSTTITYSLPEPSDVRLEVFDLLGKRVRMLDRGFKPSGRHEVTFDATGLSTGIYFYTLSAGDFSQTRKMVVVK